MFHSTRNAGRFLAAGIIAATALTMYRGFSGAPVEAAGAVQGSQSNQGVTDPTALVGSWLETVTFPPESGRPPLQSLSSYHADRTAVCTDQGNVTVNTDQPLVFSSCHGVWAHLEKRQFASTSIELISDLSGNLVGYLKVRSVVTVSQNGDEYTGNSLAEVRDPDGNVLFAVPVANTARRIQLQLP
jgi:hypothetical protein